jgi:hypothetical protein
LGCFIKLPAKQPVEALRAVVVATVVVAAALLPLPPLAVGAAGALALVLGTALTFASIVCSFKLTVTIKNSDRRWIRGIDQHDTGEQEREVRR